MEIFYGILVVVLGGVMSMYFDIKHNIEDPMLYWLLGSICSSIGMFVMMGGLK